MKVFEEEIRWFWLCLEVSRRVTGRSQARPDGTLAEREADKGPGVRICSDNRV